MRWFGGYLTTSPGAGEYLPAGDHCLLWGAPSPLWTAGSWLPHEVVRARTRDREAVAIGTCGMTAGDLATWLAADAADALPAWPGTYTVVVRDASSVTVFTDPAHAAPVYYADTGEGVVWASSSRALASVTRGTLDLVWVAAAITEPARFTPGTRSAFTGVTCALPGHRLILTRGQRPTVRSWWHVPDALSPADAAAGLRAALEQAVAARVRLAENLSCDLSGGLDSTSLCLLAARRTKPGQRITALTVHPATVDAGGDLDYARAAVANRTDISHLIVGLSEAALPYTDLDKAAPSDEPAPTTITAARHRTAYQRLAAAGSQRHLTGDGGDALLIPPPAYLYELARRGRFLRAARDVHGWAKLTETSPWPGLRDLFTRACPVNEPPPWCSQQAQQRAAESAPPPPAAASPTDAQVIADVRGTARTAYADVQAAELLGIRLDAPYFDRAVVDAALRFRLADRGSPWSYKPQITSAFADVLPRPVLSRRTKGGTDADHHRGLRVHLRTVKTLMEGWLADHGLIHPHRLRAALDAAAAGMPARFGEIEPTIAAEAWARTVTKTAPIRWTRTLLAGEPAR